MKYEFTGETKEVNGHILHRIRALKDIGVYFNDEADYESPRCIASTDIAIKKGSLGGWIESEKNLSQDDLAWVAEEAMVYEDARVCDSAIVYGDSVIGGSTIVMDRAVVHGNVRSFGATYICGRAEVDGEVRISASHTVIKDNAVIRGKVEIRGADNTNYGPTIQDNATVDGDDILLEGMICIYNSAEISGKAKLSSNGLIEVLDCAKIGENAKIYAVSANDETIIRHNAAIHDDATVLGEVLVEGNAVITGDAHLRDCSIGGDAHIGDKSSGLCICHNAYVYHHAHIADNCDYLVVNNLNGATITFFHECTSTGRNTYGFTIWRNRKTEYYPLLHCDVLRELLERDYGDNFVSVLLGLAAVARQYFNI